MNPVRRLFNSLTYRTDATQYPELAAELVVTRLPRGGRMVYHPMLPTYAEDRRRRLIREGLDPADRAMLDPDTVAALRATAARMAAEEDRAGRHGTGQSVLAKAA